MKVGDRVRILAGSNFGKFGEIFPLHPMGPDYWHVLVSGPRGSILVIPYASIELELALHVAQACSRCNTRNDFADPNQPDGSYICYECR